MSGKSKPDKFDLYQRSVQIPGGAAFLAHRYKLITGHPLRSLREDFCGTAYNCCQFVQLHPDNRATGVDLDESALRWCLNHNFFRLKESQRKRITLLKGNVLTIRTQKVQMIAALNHSYAIFKNRTALLTYFRNARKSLVRSGVMLVDQIGGTDFVNGCVHKSRLEGFVYTAEWSPIDPITHDVNIKISYYFPDRPPMRNVFGYDFRLWSLPELQEILVDAGFRNVHVILECRFKETITFRKATRGHAYDTRNCYAIVIGQA